jgi:hypothetical protein
MNTQLQNVSTQTSESVEHRRKVQIQAGSKSNKQLKIKRHYGGKRNVLREARKDNRVGERRTCRGREFQREGAEKEKERRAEEVFRKGTESREELEDLSIREGI